MIATPDVYKSSNSDLYIVFGEAKIEDPASQAAAAAALAGADPHAGHNHAHGEHDHDHDHDHDHEHDDDDDDDVPELEEAKGAGEKKKVVDDDEDGPVDETGVDAKDIELVMAQVNCSRAKAVRVLKENGNDLITASTCALLLRLHYARYLTLILRASHGCQRVGKIFVSIVVALLAIRLPLRSFHGFRNVRSNYKGDSKYEAISPEQGYNITADNGMVASKIECPTRRQPFASLQ